MSFRYSLLALLLVLAACGSDEPESLFEPGDSAAYADYEYLIPDGTWERTYAGEEVEILPARLEVSVGEVIRIVNQDSHGHFVGIFYVGAGETVTQRFSTPGEFKGQCTVHPSGELSLVVGD
ncbi:MAG: cupredoxin domain-containing protein [Acidimicrobiia bacterium]